MTTKRTPKFRHHKASGQGFVELAGKRIYLGRFDLPETEARYHRLIAEWKVGQQQTPTNNHEITIDELVARFWVHAKTYYRRPDGSHTNEVEQLKLAMRPLCALYGSLHVGEFGPLALKAVRQHMIEAGGCRTYINRHVNRIRHVFKWGVGEELVSPSVLHGLQAVAGLKRGRCEARESEPVRPVPLRHVEAVRKRVGRQVKALIDLQLLTGARAGELVMLRPVDFIDTAGKVWTARLEMHKTAHHGRERLIYFGPRAQAAVAPFLADRAVDKFLFSPAEADRERRAELHVKRKTPISCGNRPGSNRRRRPQRKPADHYSVGSYRRCIHRACDDAGIQTWGPHRLRHNAATEIRRQFGIEPAQLLLGHARV